MRTRWGTGPGTPKTVPPVLHLRLYFPTPEHFPRASLRCNTCLVMESGKRSQLPQSHTTERLYPVAEQMSVPTALQGLLSSSGAFPKAWALMFNDPWHCSDWQLQKRYPIPAASLVVAVSRWCVVRYGHLVIYGYPIYTFYINECLYFRKLLRYIFLNYTFPYGYF